jgi:hypothetical protein
MSVTLLLAALLAQSVGDGSADPRQLDRIRTAVRQPPAITIPAEPGETGRPVFRVKVQAWAFTYKPWEEPQKGIPSYIRPAMPLPHYEFLQMVTPEAFRASTLYPGMIGFSFDPGAVKKFFADWRHAAAQRSAREEVRRDFEAYLRARADAAK